MLFIALAKFIDLNLNKKTGWYYVGRFVFNGDESEGRVSQELTGISNSTQVYYYSDKNVEWHKIYKNRKNCAATTSPANYTHAIANGSYVFTVPTMPQPQFYYMAIANCKGDVAVKGKIHLEDLEWDSQRPSYNTEFDYSQQQEIEVDSILSMLFGASFISQAYNFFGKMRPRRHLFICCIFASTFSYFVGYTFRLVWGTQYAQNGESQWILGIAQLCIQLGESILLLVSLFIGQGWLISQPLLQHKAATYTLFAISICCGVAMQIYCICVPDDPIFVYELETPLGMLYTLSILACAIFFAITCLQSRKRESYAERRSLYLSLFIILLSDILVSPIAWMIGYAFPKWFREVFARLLIRGVDFVAVLIVVYLTGVEQIEDNFRVESVSGLKAGESLVAKVNVQVDDENENGLNGW